MVWCGMLPSDISTIWYGMVWYSMAPSDVSMMSKLQDGLTLIPDSPYSTNHFCTISHCSLITGVSCFEVALKILLGILGRGSEVFTMKISY